MQSYLKYKENYDRKAKVAPLKELKAKSQQKEYSEEILQQDIWYKHHLINFERIVLKDEIVTRQYYHETGQIKYHQSLLPKHLLRELLQALHGTAPKHVLGISKALQEIQQKVYYQGIAKRVQKWAKGCEICAKERRVANNAKSPELLDFPERPSSRRCHAG